MSKDQFDFNFDRKHKRPPKPKELPTPEPPSMLTIVKRRCAASLFWFWNRCVPKFGLVIDGMWRGLGSVGVAMILGIQPAPRQPPTVAPPPSQDLSTPQAPTKDAPLTVESIEGLNPWTDKTTIEKH